MPRKEAELIEQRIREALDDLRPFEDGHALGSLHLFDRVAQPGARLLYLRLHLLPRALDEAVAIGLERLQLLCDLGAGLLCLPGRGLLFGACRLHGLALFV